MCLRSNRTDIFPAESNYTPDFLCARFPRRTGQHQRASLADGLYFALALTRKGMPHSGLRQALLLRALIPSATCLDAQSRARVRLRRPESVVWIDIQEPTEQVFAILGKGPSIRGSALPCVTV